MRTIPKEFNKHGYRYTLVSRIGEIAIYSQEKGTHRNFEVMVIRKHKYDNDFTGRKAGCLIFNLEDFRVLKNGALMDGH